MITPIAKYNAQLPRCEELDRVKASVPLSSNQQGALIAHSLITAAFSRFVTPHQPVQEKLSTQVKLGESASINAAVSASAPEKESLAQVNIAASSLINTSTMAGKDPPNQEDLVGILKEAMSGLRTRRSGKITRRERKNTVSEELWQVIKSQTDPLGAIYRFWQEIETLICREDNQAIARSLLFAVIRLVSEGFANHDRRSDTLYPGLIQLIIFLSKKRLRFTAMLLREICSLLCVVKKTEEKKELSSILECAYQEIEKWRPQKIWKLYVSFCQVALEQEFLCFCEIVANSPMAYQENEPPTHLNFLTFFDSLIDLCATAVESKDSFILDKATKFIELLIQYPFETFDKSNVRERISERLRGIAQQCHRGADRLQKSYWSRFYLYATAVEPSSEEEILQTQCQALEQLVEEFTACKEVGKLLKIALILRLNFFPLFKHNLAVLIGLYQKVFCALKKNLPPNQFRLLGSFLIKHLLKNLPDYGELVKLPDLTCDWIIKAAKDVDLSKFVRAQLKGISATASASSPLCDTGVI